MLPGSVFEAHTLYLPTTPLSWFEIGSRRNLNEEKSRTDSTGVAGASYTRHLEVKRRKPWRKGPAAATPDIKIILHGHVLLKTYPPGSNRPFEVAAPGGSHLVSIYVLKYNGTAVSMPYYRLGMPNYGLLVDVQKPVFAGAYRYGHQLASAGGSGFSRSTSTDGSDFGWAVDLAELHPNQSFQWTASAGNLIYLPTGLFYTSLRTDPTAVCTTIKSPDGGKNNFYSVATRIAANIDVQPGGSFAIKNNSTGKIETDGGAFLIDGPDTRYEIHIDNNPIAGSPTMGGGDFQMYYDAVTPSLGATQMFDFAFSDPAQCTTGSLQSAAKGKEGQLVLAATNNLPCLLGVIGGP
jgi:hypothetical protein